MYKLISQVGLGGLVKAGLSEVYRKIWRQLACNSFSQSWEDVLVDKILKYQKKVFI